MVAKSLGTLALHWAVESRLPGVWLTPLLQDVAVVAAVQEARQVTLLVGGTDDPHRQPLALTGCSKPRQACDGQWLESDAQAAMEAVARAALANTESRPVVIDGGVVTRPASEVSGAVHSYLRHLRGKGLLCVPQPIAVRDGVETLHYLHGASGGEGWYHQHTEQGLVSAARLLRTIHDAGQDWVPPAGAVWGALPVTGGDGDVVFCQGDPGPWNFVWRDREAIGLIDWDYLHPAPRLDDVAYALHWFGPLRRDEFVLDWHHFPAVPDRRRRVQAFVDAYGGLPPFDVADAVMATMQATSDRMHSLARAGQEPQRTWVSDGALDRDAAEIAWVREHRTELAYGQREA